MIFRKQRFDLVYCLLQKDLGLIFLESVKSARRLDGGVTRAGEVENLLRIAAGSEALENPRVPGLKNFSATSPGRNASLLNRGLAGARGGTGSGR